MLRAIHLKRFGMFSGRSFALGHGPQAQPDARHEPHVGHGDAPARQAGHVGAAFRLDRLDRAAPAGALDQPEIVPEKTEADRERARAVARDVLERAEGGESMADLFDDYSDPAAPDSLTLPFDQINDLPPVYVELRSASSGAFVGPLEYEVSPGESRIAVVHVIEVREAGAYTYEDLRSQIASQLQVEKQREILVEELRANTYIEIRM